MVLQRFVPGQSYEREWTFPSIRTGQDAVFSVSYELLFVSNDL
jgi:hypothetical protein